MGKVYLIGVGPYDEELITLKALRVLKKCDVVIYDRLINNNILNYVRDDCKLYYCGKESRYHFKTQEEINEMLVRFAKEGYTVGRIKGGDPYVFGRGGEEALRLYEEGIEFEVIPGITSAIAALNYSGIPVTYRRISQSFHIFTGKTENGIEYDWDVIVRLNGTIVFLMGLENIEFIITNLIKNGMDKDKTCAVISNGTSERQRVVLGKLKDICEKVKDQNMTSPAVIVIGEVVVFREYLNWYEKKPLFGKKICITRPNEQAAEFKEKLFELGAGVVEVNSIKIKNMGYNLDGYIEILDKFDFILFTSVNGVEIFFKYLIDKRYDVRKLKAEFGCIGEKTGKALEERGIIPLLRAKEYVAESLFDEVKQYLKPGHKILIPRAKDARSFLKDSLLKEGAEVFEVPIYEAVYCKMGRKDIEDADYFTFTSPSTVKSFMTSYGVEVLKNKKVVAIGPITKEELIKYGIFAETAEKHTIDGIIDKILKMEGCYV